MSIVIDFPGAKRGGAARASVKRCFVISWFGMVCLPPNGTACRAQRDLVYLSGFDRDPRFGRRGAARGRTQGR